MVCRGGPWRVRWYTVEDSAEGFAAGSAMACHGISWKRTKMYIPPQNRSHLSFRPSAKMPSTWITAAVMETDPTLINRKKHGSARLCSKLSTIINTLQAGDQVSMPGSRRRFQVVAAIQARFFAAQISTALWHQHQNRTWSSAWTNACSTSEWHKSN